MTTATEMTVEAEVKQIFLAAGWSSAPYMSVKACHTKGSRFSYGTPTGMFVIDVWGARAIGGNSRSRAHMFRTTKTGVVPTEKIREWAEQRLASGIAAANVEKIRTEARASNAAIAETLREYAKAKTGDYYSSYSSTYGGYITEDSGVSGKVTINIGNKNLTEDQAKQLLDLIASFK